VPDVESHPAAWAEAVERLLRADPRALLLPVTEPAVETAQEHGLCERFSVAAPPRAAFAAAVDKARLLTLAEEAGFHVAPWRKLDEPAQLRALPAGFRFPVVLKSRRSRERDGAGWRQGGVFTVRSTQELQRTACRPELAGGALLQAFVPGHGEGLFFAVDKGRIRASFAHRRLREKPPAGGVAVCSEAIAVDASLLEPSARLLERLGFHGVGMLELRRGRGARPSLIEMNPRLWGSLQLAIDAGVDFPGWILALHGLGPEPAPTPYREGVRVRWELGTLDRLWIAARHGSPAKEEDDAPRRARSRTRLEVLRWSDPAPFARELAGWVRGALGAR
jgi:predicted ATP-grasp superfamily ATP-dependent carboligase